MFVIGDRVVYPLHGAGIIEKIEEKEILGDTQEYYILDLILDEMKIMVPTKNIDEVGMRNVIDETNFTKVLDVLSDDKTQMSNNWNRRFRANMEKLKTGDIYTIAGVVRNLIMRDIEKGLSTSERKMLEDSKQLLISEFILVKGIDEEKAAAIIDDIFYDNEDETIAAG